MTPFSVFLQSDTNMEAGAILGGMFQEDRVKTEQPPKEIKFDLEEFLFNNNELKGLFEGMAGLPTKIVKESHLFGWNGNDFCIPEKMPSKSARSTVEIQKAAQLASLIRDSEYEITASQLIYKVASEYMSWSYVHAHHGGYLKSFSELLYDEEQRKLFEEWPTTSHVSRISQLSDLLSRWDDTQSTIERLTPLRALLLPAKELIPCGEDMPLIPAAYLSLEALRQRLLSVALSGNDDSLNNAIHNSQKYQKKLLSKATAGGELSREELIQRFLTTSAEEHAMVVELNPSEVRNDNLQRLLELETIANDLSRSIVGSVTC